MVTVSELSVKFTFASIASSGIVKLPDADSGGVHVNIAVTELPVVGSDGVIVAPGGSTPEVSVTAVVVVVATIGTLTVDPTAANTVAGVDDPFTVSVGGVVPTVAREYRMKSNGVCAPRPSLAITCIA